MFKLFHSNLFNLALLAVIFGCSPSSGPTDLPVDDQLDNQPTKTAVAPPVPAVIGPTQTDTPIAPPAITPTKTVLAPPVVAPSVTNTPIAPPPITPSATAIAPPVAPPTPPPSGGSSGGSCPGAPPQRLNVGDIAYVCTLSDPVRLRAGAGKNFNYITSLDKGTELYVVDGPICADNWSWWQVETESGDFGWMAEGGDNVDPYFLCPR